MSPTSCQTAPPRTSRGAHLSRTLSGVGSFISANIAGVESDPTIKGLALAPTMMKQQTVVTPRRAEQISGIELGALPGEGGMAAVYKGLGQGFACGGGSTGHARPVPGWPLNYFSRICSRRLVR